MRAFETYLRLKSLKFFKKYPTKIFRRYAKIIFIRHGFYSLFCPSHQIVFDHRLPWTEMKSEEKTTSQDVFCIFSEYAKDIKIFNTKIPQSFNTIKKKYRTQYTCTSTRRECHLKTKARKNVYPTDSEGKLDVLEARSWGKDAILRQERSYRGMRCWTCAM